MALTKQEVFDKVCDHFKTQKVRAYSGGLCQYLTTDGRKCAIGIFIPEGHPSQKALGSVGSIFREYPDIEALFEKNSYTLPFLGDIQCAHDNEDHWDENGFNFRGWKYMKQLAMRQNLDSKLVQI